jgi:hypothetical protein
MEICGERKKKEKKEKEDKKKNIYLFCIFIILKIN